MSQRDLLEKPTPVVETPRPLPEDCATIDGIMARASCRVKKLFVSHDARKAQSDLKSEIKAIQTNKAQKLDLRELGSQQNVIGSETMTRKLLF